MTIAEIADKCDAGKIKWTAHALERIEERGIERTDIISCIKNGKIIEQYPEAYPYPACLILGKINSADDKSLATPVHVVLGHGNGYIWVITAYKPNEIEWSNDFSARKE